MIPMLQPKHSWDQDLLKHMAQYRGSDDTSSNELPQNPEAGQAQMLPLVTAC